MPTSSSERRPRVLVVGVGGLGCPAAEVLARSGACDMTLVDDDLVDVTNLHRQILFREADVGRPKVDVARERLLEVAPASSVDVVRARIDVGNVLALVAAAAVVVEGSDNFPTKFLVADACRLAGRALVSAACVGTSGTALLAGGVGAPCYRCVFEDLPIGEAPNCATAGVLGPVAGIVGALAADLALGFLAGSREPGTLLRFEDGAAGPRFRRVRIAQRADCLLCGPRRRIRSLDETRYAGPRCEAP